MVWHGALGHFAVSSPTTPWCPGMAGHVATVNSTGIDKKAPRRLGLLSPYKRAGHGSTTGRGERRTTTDNEEKQEIDTSSNHPCPFFLSLRLGLDALSRMLVTPTRAPRCKEIQTSPPPSLDVGPSFARTRINPRVFSLHHHLGKRHATFTRWFRTPSGPNTDSWRAR
jgi:hypothetical protein